MSAVARWSAALALSLSAMLGRSAASWAGDPNKDEALLTSWFPGLASAMRDAPPFFRDTRLLLQIRSYYRNNEPSSDTLQSGRVKGLQIRTRAALVDLEGTPGLLPDVRLILNWLPLF